MSGRQFSKISPAVWRSGRFIGLGDPKAQLLYLYFLSCEHQNSAGCFRLPDGYACSDLGWQRENYLKARAALTEAELVTFDPATSEIYVDRWFRHNAPMNVKHAEGTRRLISAIESDIVREKAEAEFEMADSERVSKINPLDTPFQNNRSPALLSSRMVNGGRGK
jgi:hypothetical protein